MIADYAGGAFLAVSLLSLALYVLAVRALHRAHAEGRPRRAGLVRTAYSRVGAAVLYVSLAVAGLAAGPSLPTWLAAVVFTAVQAVWQTNSALDVRLQRRLRRTSTPLGDPRGDTDPRHRAGRPHAHSQPGGELLRRARRRD